MNKLEQRKALLKQGFTHIVTFSPTGRPQYYNIKLHTYVGRKMVLATKNFKVFDAANQTEFKVQESTLASNRARKSNVAELIAQGYTHIKYSNRNYYNLKDGTLDENIIAKVKDIKVFCSVNKTDITSEAKQSISEAYRFKDVEETKEGTVPPSQLITQGFTHKRCSNRKIYDLIKKQYTTVDKMTQNGSFKIYNEKSASDVSHLYAKN